MFLICAIITLAIQITGFILAFILQTEKFYDILGGLNYLVLALYSSVAIDSSEHAWSDDKRKVACTLVFVSSRGWLLLFLAWRAHERGGDSRFDGVKDKFGKFLVFWLVQGLWVFIISLPLIFVNSSSVWKPSFSGLDCVSLSCFGVGVFCEIVADIQKSIWVKQGRIGGFCCVGIWKYSRHPNYFGEMLQWWACWIFAFSSGVGISDLGWWSSILSPLFTMQILLNTDATGIPQANGKNLKRYYDKCPVEYSNYRETTSILLPMVGYNNIPLFLKRSVLLDLERWEYFPKEKKVNNELKADNKSE